MEELDCRVKIGKGLEKNMIGLLRNVLAGGPGIEPGFLDPKSNVLPLDDPPTEHAL